MAVSCRSAEPRSRRPRATPDPRRPHAAAAGRASLKRAAGPADPECMATEVKCPICSADVPLGGDERNGDEVFCSVCGAPLKLQGNYGDEVLDAEEDF